MGENAQSWPEFELKHFITPYMQLPLPAVFHDKAKRTQQGNPLSGYQHMISAWQSKYAVQKTREQNIKLKAYRARSGRSGKITKEK